MKNNPRRAGALEAFLRELAGVDSVAANTVTGSLVIQYDVETGSADSILGHLKAAGFEVTDGVEPAVPRPTAPSKQLGQRVVNSVVETILERSAVALISALI